jgi:hypothetical protein
MTNPTDLIDRELNVDDFVVFHNNIYRVKGLGKANPSTGNGSVRIMSINPSKTTRPVIKYSSDLCKLDPREVIIWMLKKGYKE